MRRKTPDDYRALAKRRGFKWRGAEVTNANTRTGWECIEGHLWQAPYSNIRLGSGCPYCSRMVRKTPDDYHALAKKRGFKWLGSEVTNVNTKTEWECAKGHHWRTTYSSITTGRRCRECAGLKPYKAGMNKRKTPADYHALAKRRGFKWLGPEVTNAHTKTEWECVKGHHWQVRYNKIQQGSGCPHCLSRARKLPDDYHALAESRGFKWLGSEVRNTKTRTEWQCAQGHHWQGVYSSIQQGGGCAVCAGRQLSKPHGES